MAKERLPDGKPQSTTSTRRDRERQQMRERLLAAARDIAVEDGWGAVTIRRIASKLEYSAPILYQHFSSKESLLVELMMVGFAELGGELAATARVATGDRLAAMGEAYWAFAFRTPELYQVMNAMGGVPFGTAETPPQAREAFRTFRTVLENIAEARGARLVDPPGAVDTMWAFLHGCVSLAMAGRVAGGIGRARTLMLAGLDPLFSAQLQLDGSPEADPLRMRDLVRHEGSSHDEEAPLA